MPKVLQYFNDPQHSDIEMKARSTFSAAYEQQGRMPLVVHYVYLDGPIDSLIIKKRFSEVTRSALFFEGMLIGAL